MNDYLSTLIPRSILNRLEDRGLSPVKLGSVIGLGILFALVIAIQWFRSSGGSDVAVESESPESTVVSVARATSAAVNGTEGTSVAVPMVPVGRDSHPEANEPIETPSHRVTIERIVRIDPFARIETIASSDERNPVDVPAAEMDSSRGRSAEVPQTESQRPLTVDQIVIGPNGAAVRIGEKWYGVGQRWEHYRIEAIRRDGVVLSAD